MTGDASGPHLHLQLNPQTMYPQSLPWFRNFANVAFRWKEPTPPGYPEVSEPAAPATAGAVFAVVPDQQPTTASGPVVLFTR